MRCWVYCKMVRVGPLFRAQAQQVGDSSPRSPRQWICRERVTELGPNEVSVSWLWAIQRLNVRISPSCPLDIRSEETYGCTSVPNQRLWSFSLSSTLSSSLFHPLLHGDSLILYSPLEVIRTLHLLIIWTFTWVFVSSNISPIFLWIVVAKVTLLDRKSVV